MSKFQIILIKSKFKGLEKINIFIILKILFEFMKKEEKSENSDSNELNEEDDDDSEIDSDYPNLFKLNKIIEKKRRKEEQKLMEKKRKRTKNETDIVFDANKKRLEDSFIPNLEELNDFLKNCRIREIDINEIEKELEKIPKEKIFDPEKFIKENYGKEEQIKKETNDNFSIEDFCFKYDKKEEEIKDNFDDFDKIKEKEIINDLYQEKNLNQQKKDIHKLIEKIKKMNIEEIIKTQEGNANKKLNIVLDLDNTCIFAFQISHQDQLKLILKYPEKEIFFIEFMMNGNFIISALLIRKGLKEFFDFTKNFCNFYINTLGYENYGLEIKNNLEKKFGVKFIGFKGRKNELLSKKNLYDLSLESKNAVIFDDKPIFWKREDKYNIIISKLFTDREIILDNLKRNNLENNLYSFLKVYTPFFYYKSSEEKWQNQKLIIENSCPFYDIHKKICFSGEYLESTKYQFIYMKEVVKIIYYLIYNSNIRVPDALKIIRYNIFYNSYFNLKFYKNNGINILKEIIKNCGGIIIEDNKNKNEYKELKLFYVCSFEDYNKYKEDIKKEKIWMDNAKVVSEKYILNSFYFMTNLEDELDNPQYCFDFKEEDNFDNY